MVYKVSVTRGGKPTLPGSGFPTVTRWVERSPGIESSGGQPGRVHLAAKRVP
jgi:hypothetical protein